MLEEQVVDRIAGRCQVFLLHRRPQVLDQGEFDAVVKRVSDHFPCVNVAGEDHRHSVLAAETRLRLGGGHHLGDLNDMLRGAAICAAGDQDHVRPQFPDPLDLLVWQSLVVGGDGVHHDRPGSQCGSLGAGGGHFADHSGDHHLQSTSRAGSGDVEVTTFRFGRRTYDLAVVIDQATAGQFSDLGHRIDHTHRHIGGGFLDRGGGFPAERLPILSIDLFDQDCLGRGAAAVGRQDHVDLIEIDGSASSGSG